ncbi:hypothetical protein O7623_23655 [Solwaraspora sp. WMMD791]|uniref:hypothetical protein n=1 Tax=Solwaraspora sp. WMMD791 TaxID=3016086 RepID=UPI00249AC153|nr:hypothetical protein [Solwaraspora sp. WMMD791]WFE26309.1 hypothetical protein O7623_23655 [Solwaraspora sp. WMMD791]
MQAQHTTESSSPGEGGPHQLREQAGQVGHEAAHEGRQLANQATEQGKRVVNETGRQARNLVGEATSQLREQASTQQRRAADGLRTIGNELQEMADKGQPDGLAGELARRASDAAQQAAGWLENRQPGELVDEVRQYARRHPGTFLAGAAFAGLLVGRLTRSLSGGQAGSGQQDQQDTGGNGHRPDPGDGFTAPPPVAPIGGEYGQPLTAGRRPGVTYGDGRYPDGDGYPGSLGNGVNR